MYSASTRVLICSISTEALLLSQMFFSFCPFTLLLPILLKEAERVPHISDQAFFLFDMYILQFCSDIFPPFIAYLNPKP